MTGFADAFAPPEVRIECPGSWTNRHGADVRCNRFVINVAADGTVILDPAPCPSCGARYIVRIVGGALHFEMVRRARGLTGLERTTDTPPEHT